jgi:uncharacterized protein (TIGR02301 family)
MMSHEAAMHRLRNAILVFALLATLPAQAAEAAYDGRMLRLAEILGSLHYLRNLCGEPGAQWRDRMEQILAAENPEPDRRARYVASFNRGYAAYAKNYSVCTDTAMTAIDLYMKEGETLSREIVARFAN